MEGHVGSRRSFDVVKNTTVTFLVKYCKEIFQKIINVCLKPFLVKSEGTKFHSETIIHLRVISKTLIRVF